MRKIKILIADDHKMIRELLISKLKSNKRFCVINEAENGKEVIMKIKKDLPDVVLMDIEMPFMDGIKCTKILQKYFPTIKVLILSSYENPESILQSLTYGAKGYILKTAPLKEVYDAIESLYRGQTFFSQRVSKILLEKITENITEKKQTLEGLTVREVEILKLVASGLVNKQIADRLHIKTRTAGKHREKIMLKLNLHSIAELTNFAIKNNLV